MLKQSNIDFIKTQCSNIMDNLSIKTCCFTGHRPQKLPWAFNETSGQFLTVKNQTKNEIINAIDSGYQFFISGMALGFDMMCAGLILDLKTIYPHIKLECALPCETQDKLWNQSQKERYHSILNCADKVSVISKVYTETCMIDRNIYMVNNSSLVIALYNGKSGGTKRTIDYAKSKGLKVILI